MALRSWLSAPLVCIFIVLFHVKFSNAGSTNTSLQSSLGAEEGILLIHNHNDAKAMRSILQFWNETTPNISDVLPGWSMDVLPCDPAQGWTGVLCTAVKVITQTDKDGKTSISEYLNITGILLQPPSPLTSPSIVGELPSALGDLKNLQSLEIIGYHSLSGSIPPSIWELPNLQVLGLNNNNLSGSINIPPSSGRQLYSLQLCNNFFTGQVPWTELNNNANLSLLLLNNNNFSGNLGKKLSASYNYLDLSFNYFTGPLEFEESAESNSVSLITLYVTNNYFEGTFPTNNFPNLTSLDLSINNFTGLGSIGAAEFMPLLTTLGMKNNGFKGEFPASILENSKLAYIYCDFNQFNGSLRLPKISFQDSSLSTISILDNDISDIDYPDPIPNSILSAYNLEQVDLLFLGGNPICIEPQSTLLARLCRFNNSSPMQDNMWQYHKQGLTYVNKNNNHKIVIIASSSTSAIVFLISICAFFIITQLLKKIIALRKIQQEFIKKDIQPYIYSYNELKIATQDFHPSNKLGEGGFGVVYKGIMRDGTKVAVKQLIKSQQMLPEFLNEIVVISGVRHRNLVKLKGCCISGDQRILVYEYVENHVENQNLAEVLWGSSTKSGDIFDWPTRFNIILGIAKGLAYLHEEVHPPIIHRDIKGPNILLDKNLEAKIVDFGTALLFPSFSDEESHLSLQHIAGTRGYLSPEYASYGHVSTKVDVFSFGVLVLEIISGRKNIDYHKPADQQILSEWALRLSELDHLEELVDKNLRQTTPKDEITRMINLGLSCQQFSASDRPSMSDVVAMILGNKQVNTNFKYESSDYGFSLSETGVSAYESSVAPISEET